MVSLTEMIEDKTIILQLGDEIYELEIDAIEENIIILGSTELEDILEQTQEED